MYYPIRPVLNVAAPGQLNRPASQQIVECIGIFRG